MILGYWGQGWQLSQGLLVFVSFRVTGKRSCVWFQIQRYNNGR